MVRGFGNAPFRTFELLKIVLLKFPPRKMAFKYPTLSAKFDVQVLQVLVYTIILEDGSFTFTYSTFIKTAKFAGTFLLS